MNTQLLDKINMLVFKALMLILESVKLVYHGHKTHKMKSF